MFNKIGIFSVKYRWWIIAAWVVLAGLLFILAPALSQVSSMKESSFLPADSQSLRAREIISQYFPETQAASSVSLVFYNAGGISESDRNYARQVGDWLGSGETGFQVKYVTSIFANPELESRLISPDKTTMLLSAGLEKAAFESDSAVTTQEIREYVKSAPQGLEIYVSGQVGIYSDVYDSLSKSIDLTTLVTVVLVIVLLIIIYRSPIAALVPLITIGIAFVTARGITAFIGQAGVSIWSQIEIFFIVMIFGIGTDYCLFLISRFREEMEIVDDRKEAMRRAVSKVGVVISASALAVIAGLSGLAVAQYQMIKTMGPLLGIAIFITLLAALTLTPAIASIFGKILFWPRSTSAKKESAPKRPGIWSKIAGLTVRRPWLVAGIALLIMLLPYLALPRLNSSFDQMAEIPADSESIKGFIVLKEHYDIGEMDPLTTLIIVPPGKDLTSSESLAALNQIQNELKKVDGVVKIQYILDPQGSGLPLDELTASGQLTLIQTNLAATLEKAAIDPSWMENSTINAGFNQIQEYLKELSASFNWVNNEQSFRNILIELDALRVSLEKIDSQTLVENQLTTIRQQIAGLAQNLNNPLQLMTPETQNALQSLQAYFEALGKQYPELQKNPEYLTLTATLGQFMNALANAGSLSQAESAALLNSLPASLQLIDSGLQKMTDYFHGSGSRFFQSGLSMNSAAGSLEAELKTRAGLLIQNLQALSQTFRDKGNPALLASSLLSDNTQAKALMSSFFDGSRRAAKMYIVLDSYPQSDAALKTVNAARSVLSDSLAQGYLADSEAVIGGTSAELADVQTVLNSDFKWIMAVVLIVVFIVLALLLRSLLAPIYLLITVLLSYGTTLGLESWIFQGLMGQDGISFLIPIIVLVLLVALGSDYNIFLMSRVKEESHQRKTAEGVRLAVIATGGVITACGIILAGTFGALLATPIRTLMQIGAAVSIGVIIDTFIVRALLVPAIARLLGRWNWWPSKIFKEEKRLKG